MTAVDDLLDDLLGSDEDELQHAENEQAHQAVDQVGEELGYGVLGQGKQEPEFNAFDQLNGMDLPAVPSTTPSHVAVTELMGLPSSKPSERPSNLPSEHKLAVEAGVAAADVTGTRAPDAPMPSPFARTSTHEAPPGLSHVEVAVPPSTSPRSPPATSPPAWLGSHAPPFPDTAPPAAPVAAVSDGHTDEDDMLMLDGLEDLLHEPSPASPAPVPAAVTPLPPPARPPPGIVRQVSADNSSAVYEAADTTTGHRAQVAEDSTSHAAQGSAHLVPTLSRRVQPQSSGGLASTTSVLPDQQDALLQDAEDTERSLLTGAGPEAVGSDPGERLQELLADARQDWPAQGRPDAAGSMVGGSVALKLEELLRSVPDLAAALGSTGGGGAHAGGGRPSPYGTPRVVSAQGTVLAVGTSLGVTLVVQMPSLSAAAAAAAAGSTAVAVAVAATHSDDPRGPAGHTAGRGGHPGTAQGGHAPGAHSGGGGGAGGGAAQAAGSASSAPLLVMGEPRSEAESVTALGFSRVDGPGDPLWLLVGHASGTVTVWELQRRGRRLVTTISGQHGLPVTHASFAPGRGVSLAVTADRRGRLVAHVLATNLLLGRTTASSKPLLDGSLGIISDVVHLQPFAAALPPPVGGTEAGTDGGAATGGDRAKSGGAAPGGQPGVGVVGEGVAALCTPTGCHIARFRPTGELALLTVLPKPEGAAGLPTAAWAQHGRRAGGAAVLTAQLPATALRGAPAAAPPPTGGQPGMETVTVPCASLAVAWGQLVVFCDVPLYGDHKGSSPASLSAMDAVSAAAAAVAGAANANTSQGMGMSLLRSVTAAASATASRVAAPDPLPPHLVKQLALAFPIQVLRKWDTRALDDAAGNSAPGGAPASQGYGAGLHVLGLHWFDGESLGVVVQQGLQVRLAVLGPDLDVKEQVDCFDPPPPSPYLPSPPSAPCCPSALAGSGSRVVLLGSSGALYCCRLMGWQERLRTLQDVGKERLALWYGLEFYKMHLARRHAAAAAGVAPSDADASLASQQAQWILGLLLTHTATELHACVTATAGSQPPQPPGVVQRCRDAAELCICCCLLLGLQQPLFQQLFQQFQAAHQQLSSALPPRAPDLLSFASDDDSASQHSTTPSTLTPLNPLGVFLEALEPHILADRLPCLAPEVVHALVNHFASPEPGSGRPAQPQRVERCVLHLDVFHLDLDQVLRLCAKHGLFSALIYVHNRISEYRQPVLDMLAFMAAVRAPPGHPPGRAEVARVARKLLVYLRCTFRGEAFPPGSGELAAVGLKGGGGAGLAGELRAQLLGLLLFTDSQDLAREWQVPLSTVQAAVDEPYPCLQLLLSSESAATVRVLGEAVQGWDAVETELRAAAGKPAQELESVLVATQVLVNALVALLDSPPGLAQPRSSGQDSGGAAAGGQPRGRRLHSASAAAAILDFVTALVVARRVTVAPRFLLTVLQHVLQPPAGSGVLHARLSATAGPLLSVDVSGAPARTLGGSQGGAVEVAPDADLPLHPSTVAEQLAVRLVDVVGVNAVTPPGARQAADRLNSEESSRAIQLLLQHGMRLGAAHVHHLRGEVRQALALHLQLPQRDAAFTYIRTCLQSGQAATRQALTDAVLASGPQLVAASPAGAAAALLALDPGQQPSLLKQLTHVPEQRFHVLRALMALCDHLQHDAQQHGFAVEDDGEGGTARPAGPTPGRGLLAVAAPSAVQSSPWGDESLVFTSLAAQLLPAGSPAVPRAQDLRHNSGACTDYVLLACRYAPVAVLPFLLRHTTYDVRQCLAAVQQAGVREAHAYLLERLGELDQAFTIHLTRIKETSAALRGWFATHGQQVGHTTGRSGYDTAHIVWLLALSPRLRTSLAQICGTEQYRAAVQQYEQYKQVYKLASQDSGVGLPSGAVLAAGHRTAVQGAGSEQGAPLDPIAPVPPELVVFWRALTTATAFCTRCSRTGRTPLPPPAAAGAGGSRAGSPAGVAAGGTTTGSAGTTAAQGKAAQGGAGTGRDPTWYWLQLLETYIQLVRDCAAGPAARGTGVAGLGEGQPGQLAAHDHVALRHVMAAGVEEVVGCASDHVPLSDLVRHVSTQHGEAAVGEFRGLLSGLLSACSYEQAIMHAALRLVAHDALAQVRTRCLRHSAGLSDAEAHATGDSQDEVGASGPGHSSGVGGGLTGQSQPLQLVTEQVHHSVIAGNTGVNTKGESRPGPSAVAPVVLTSHAGSAAAALEAGLSAAGLDPAPLLQHRADRRGDYPDFLEHGGSYVHTKINMRSVLRSLGLPLSVIATPSYEPGSPSRALRGRGSASTSSVPVTPQAPRTAARPGSFDVDNLLQWAAGASSVMP